MARPLTQASAEPTEPQLSVRSARNVVEERDDTALRIAASLPCDQARPDRFGCYSVVSSPTFYKSFRCRRFVVDVSSDSGVAHASIRGAATPCIPCQRGLSTVEFHEGRLCGGGTDGAPSHQAWLRYLGWP